MKINIIKKKWGRTYLDNNMVIVFVKLSPSGFYYNLYKYNTTEWTELLDKDLITEEYKYGYYWLLKDIRNGEFDTKEYNYLDNIKFRSYKKDICDLCEEKGDVMKFQIIYRDFNIDEKCFDKLINTTNKNNILRNKKNVS